MEDTWSEYVDLISTASLDLHPQNHGALFTNQLPIPQQLPENAYVCLEELEYTHCFYNVTPETVSMTVFDMNHEYLPNTPKNSNSYPIYGKFILAPLKEGNYDTVEKLCLGMNNSLKACGVKELENHEVFSYDPISMKFVVDVEGLNLSLWLRGDILNYLGIETTRATVREYVVLGKPKETPTFEYVDPNDTSSPPKKETRHFTDPHVTWESASLKKFTGEYVAQLTVVNSFVVYVDCIQSQVTGDTFSDALRIVAIKGTNQPGTRIITEFEKVYRLKVNKRYIPSITVRIKDIFGRDIKFLMGNVRIKLRFSI